MAFVTHDGLCCFTRVPCVLVSAPNVFQRMMSQILSDQDGVQCYLDCIIVYGEDPEVHEKQLQAILKQWFEA